MLLPTHSRPGLRWLSSAPRTRQPREQGPPGPGSEPPHGQAALLGKVQKQEQAGTHPSRVQSRTGGPQAQGGAEAKPHQEDPEPRTQILEPRTQSPGARSQDPGAQGSGPRSPGVRASVPGAGWDLALKPCSTPAAFSGLPVHQGIPESCLSMIPVVLEMGEARATFGGNKDHLQEAAGGRPRVLRAAGGVPGALSVSRLSERKQVQSPRCPHCWPRAAPMSRHRLCSRAGCSSGHTCRCACVRTHTHM